MIQTIQLTLHQCLQHPEIGDHHNACFHNVDVMSWRPPRSEIPSEYREAVLPDSAPLPPHQGRHDVPRIIPPAANLLELLASQRIGMSTHFKHPIPAIIDEKCVFVEVKLSLRTGIFRTESLRIEFRYTGGANGYNDRIHARWRYCWHEHEQGNDELWRERFYVSCSTPINKID